MVPSLRRERVRPQGGILGKYACICAGVVCDGFIDLIGGSSDNINASRVHVYVTQTPAGSSVKNMAHYAEGIRDETFAFTTTPSNLANRPVLDVNFVRARPSMAVRPAGIP
ncbi:hypothetical protein ON010_g13202 [Phytophthora cinnamomi]|nr:hypothetical protein ON010_g13202 [Phytophthora cinnamomi]